MVRMGLLLKFLKWDQHLSEKALLKKSWSWMLLGSIELGIPPLMVTIREHATSENISAPKSVLWFSTSKARERGFLLVSESSSKETNHKGNKEQYRLHWRNGLWLTTALPIVSEMLWEQSCLQNACSRTEQLTEGCWRPRPKALQY